jgi:pimeloyl-ACP methyl ester carboxylesterase
MSDHVADMRGRTEMSDDSRRLAFEHHRLELFKAHGFDASAAWFGNSDGHRTAAVVGGEGELPVLLIHGVLNDAGEWALIAGALSRRLVIPDWPGCGLSDAVPVGPMGFRRFGVEWLTGLVDELGAEQVDIVGSSMGGYLGCVFALAQPERVRRLVQIGSEFGLVRGAPMFFRLLVTPGLGTFMLSRQPKDAEANRKQVFSHLVRHPERIPVDMLEHDLTVMGLPGAVDSANDVLRALAHPLTGTRPSVMISEELADLKVPTLYLWGTRDNFLRPEKARPAFEQATAVTFRTIEDGGHLLTWEAPDVVANAITEFLRAPD